MALLQISGIGGNPTRRHLIYVGMGSKDDLKVLAGSA